MYAELLLELECSLMFQIMNYRPRIYINAILHIDYHIYFYLK